MQLNGGDSLPLHPCKVPDTCCCSWADMQPAWARQAITKAVQADQVGGCCIYLRMFIYAYLLYVCLFVYVPMCTHCTHKLLTETGVALEPN